MTALEILLKSVHSSPHEDARKVLFRIVKTSREMLVDRGYENVVASPDPWSDVVSGSPVVTSTGCHVLFHNEAKVGVKVIRSFMEETEETQERLVCISVEGPTPYTKAEVSGGRVQFLLARSMSFNPTRHHLVPEHVVVTDHTRHHSFLPKILQSDPITVYYDWPLGTVVKIVRRFGGHGPVPYYRVVSARKS